MATPRKDTPEALADRGVNEAMNEAYEDQVRRLAGEHAPDAIKTLADVMDVGGERKVSDSQRRLAANNLLEHGHARARPKPGSGGVGRAVYNLTVIHFAGGVEHREKLGVVEDVGATMDAIELEGREVDGD